MRSSEAKDRIDTIYWVFNVALISINRYRVILKKPHMFSVVFPQVSFENPKITNTIGKVGDNPEEIYTTSKMEILNEGNFNLYKCWQIISGISGMTSVFEYYLKTVSDELSGDNNSAMGIFHNRFRDYTGINLSDFKGFNKLRYYYEVRNISIHNLGRINKRFKNKIAQQNIKEGPHIFFPKDISKYRNLIHSMIDFIEAEKNIRTI